MTAPGRSPRATGLSWPFTLVSVACGTALCWWTIANAAIGYTLQPWYGWTQGRVVIAELASEMRPTGNGKERQFFNAVIICAYEVDGVTHRLRLSDPEEWYWTDGEAGIHIRRLPPGKQVPIFFDRQSPATAKAVRTVNLTYLLIPALLTIATAWLIRRECDINRPTTSPKTAARYVGSLPALAAFAYFLWFRVLDGKSAFSGSSGRWSSAPDLLLVWILFSLGFSLIAWAIAGQMKKTPAQPAKPVA